MKKSTSIIIVLTLICINMSVNANCFLDTYFKKSNIDKQELTLVFYDLGARYRIKTGDQNRISEYGEKIVIKKNTSVRLVDRDVTLVISSIKKDIADELRDIDIKNLNLLANYTFLVKEKIDLRSMKKDIVEKTFLIFVTDNLPEEAKEVLSSLKSDKQFTAICEHEKMLIIEYAPKKDSSNIKDTSKN